MWIRIQEPPECVSTSETLVENFAKNFNFSRKRKLFAKTIPGTKIFSENENSPKHWWMLPKNYLKKLAKATIFAKRNFAKSERVFAYFRENEKGVFVSTPIKTLSVSSVPVYLLHRFLKNAQISA
jgi:hypothetical protein